ncbi:MAG: InlB B-repeat-containing protein, partial [Lentisphaeraceae bacterium]|nr:InlB B-repeat-containing protein [Lentisphaeraceae bacterium]
VVTNNDVAAVTRRLRNIDTDSFQLRIQEEETPLDDGHGTETVSYIIIPPGDYSFGGELFTVGTQAGIDEVWDTVPSTGYERFIGTFQTVGGADPGAMRMKGTIGTNLQIQFEEERSRESEKGHANETVGYVLTGNTSTPLPVTYEVTFVAGANGSISGVTPQTINEGEDAQTVTAVADSGYEFDQWNDGVQTAARTVIDVQSNITLTATFKLNSGGPVNPPITGTILSQSFDLSDLNRRDSVTYQDGTSWAYTYDQYGNLETADKTHGSDPNKNLEYDYSYDPIGNRLTSTLATSSTTSTKNYTPNELNQYDVIEVDGSVIRVLYDEDGNPTTNGDWDLTWDAEDRLSTMAHQTEDILLEFKYDYRGFRGEKKVTVNGTVTKHIGFLYDGNLVSAELDIRDGAQKLIRKYTWGLDPAGTRQEVGGIGALVGMETFNADGSSQKHHVVSDAGGNVTAVLSSNDDDSVSVANTYEYGPFGQVIAKSETVFNPYRFNSKPIIDELVGDNDYNYGYRDYDAENGRWWNQDPIGVEGGINTYNSVSNNMVNGFAGGMSYSGGMERRSGFLRTSFNLDSYGREIKQTFPINNYLGRKAGDVTFTYGDKTEVRGRFNYAGASIKGGFKFLSGGLRVGIEFQCEELRWIQVFTTNLQFGWGRGSYVDPVFDPPTGNPDIDYNKNLNYDNYPFYHGGLKEGLQKSNGYEAYFQDNPMRAWEEIDFNSPTVFWEAELALVAVNDKDAQDWEVIKVFKYGFKLAKSYNILNHTFSHSVKEDVSKRLHILSPSKIISSDKSSANFDRVLQRFLNSKK